MILDLNTYAARDPIRGAVCLVGCGAVGMAMARELGKHHIDTIVVDGGSERDEPQTQALYDCEIVGLPFVGATSGRFRVVGGSTTRWGGQALPMDPIDFEPRDWVAHSGWPIALDDVWPYYQPAAEYMHVDSGDYGAGLADELGATVPPVDPQVLRFHFSKWAPRPSLRELYLDGFQRVAPLRLFMHANVTRIDLTEDRKSVKRMVVRSLEGATATVEAVYFVLCAGGIENARLLLANEHDTPGGIGNQHDVVGRFLQDHPTARAALIETSSPRELQRMFNVFYRRGRKYAVRLSASEAFQRHHLTLNLSSGISFQARSESAIGMLKQAYRRFTGREARGDLWGELATIASSPATLVRPAYEYFVRGRQYVPDATYVVNVIAEQEPDPTSRISLAQSFDALGVRKAKIDWRLQPSVGRSIQLFARALEREFGRLGLGRMVLTPWLERDDAEWRAQISDVNHHIGTTRMSDNPRRGVVDGNCKVHGIDNLYIAGSSVFPTGGHSNPTFTALALAYRTCGELRQRLQLAT